MNRPSLSPWLPAVALMALVAFSAAEANADNRTVIDRIVAKVNDDIITLNDLKRASGAHLLARRMTREQVDNSPQSEEIYRGILQDMINTRLLVQEARDLQLEVNEEDVDRWIDNVVRAEGATEEQFRDELRSRGIRWRDYRRYIKESLLKVRVVQVKVASRVNVSDTEVERAYQERFGAAPGEGVKAADVSHILIPLPEDADDQKKADVQALLDRTIKDLDRGRPFAEVAREVSSGPMADSGGHLGRFKPGDMREEYDPLFDLEPGEYTSPILSDAGYHIFRVNDTFVERDPKVDSRLDSLRNQMLAKQRDKELKLWLESLRKRAYVKVMY